MIKDEEGSLDGETVKELRSALPPITARQHLKRYGWPYAVGYMSNRDSEGTGPEGAFRCGRLVVYPREGLIRWLAEQSTSLSRGTK
jgi:hypothetical protein